MGANTAIEWAHHTFSPWWGCTKVSEACRNCYAEAWAKRTGHGVWGATSRRRFFGDKHWREPLKWNRKAEAAGERRRVFCASMADVFEWLPDDHPDREAMRKARLDLWDLIDATPWLDWLLLTKRPENARVMLGPEPPRNIWLGTTVEDQETADERIPHLLRVPAAVRFLSCEPLLEPVHLRESWLLGAFDHCDADEDEENGRSCEGCEGNPWPKGSECAAVRGPRIHWVIVGGESGGGARPFNLQWARDIASTCERHYTPCFIKQLGAHPITQPNGKDPAHRRLKLADRKGGAMVEWPRDLCIREVPRP